MKDWLHAGMIAALALPTAVHAAQQADEAQIRAIVADQAAAWNRGDAQAFARDVAEGISFTNLFGMVFYGKQAFTARQQDILAGFYRGTRKVHAVRRIRFITPDVAIVDIDNELSNITAMPPGIPLPPNGILRSQLMQIFVRRNGRWQIEAFHNVEVRSPPGRG